MTNKMIGQWSVAMPDGITVHWSGDVTENTHQQVLDVLRRPKPFVMTQIPCLSYGHMSVDTDLWLQHACSEGAEEGPGFQCALTEGACFLTAPPQEDYEQFPKDLQDIFAWADQHAPYGWIMLDVDGDVQPGLPHYDTK